MRALVFTGYLLLVLGCLIAIFSRAGINSYEHARYAENLNIPSPTPAKVCFGTCGDAADVPAFDATYYISDTVFGIFAAAAAGVFIRVYFVNGRRWTIGLGVGFALDASLIVLVTLINL